MSLRFHRLHAPDVALWLAAHPGALVLDARDPASHAQGQLAGALLLDGRNHERLLMREPKDRPVFIYCYHGNASQTYAQMFSDFGFANVADLVGGWEAWLKADIRPAATPQPSRPAPPALLTDWLATQGMTDVHSPGAHGNTPLMVAAWRGEAAVVDALLAQGVSLTAVNGDGNNALWLGCVAHNPAIVTRLVKAGVPIDHANATGATCLMYAASSSKPVIVRTLLALGADPTIRTQDDYTALDMAADIDSLRLLHTATRATPAA